MTVKFSIGRGERELFSGVAVIANYPFEALPRGSVSVVLEDLLCEEVFDLGLIAEHLEVRSPQKL